MEAIVADGGFPLHGKLVKLLQHGLRDQIWLGCHLDMPTIPREDPSNQKNKLKKNLKQGYPCNSMVVGQHLSRLDESWVPVELRSG